LPRRFGSTGRRGRAVSLVREWPQNSKRPDGIAQIVVA
jgi:hypothetical protein